MIRCPQLVAFLVDDVQQSPDDTVSKRLEELCRLMLFSLNKQCPSTISLVAVRGEEEE